MLLPNVTMTLMLLFLSGNCDETAGGKLLLYVSVQVNAFHRVACAFNSSLDDSIAGE